MTVVLLEKVLELPKIDLLPLVTVTPRGCVRSGGVEPGVWGATELKSYVGPASPSSVAVVGS